MMSRASATRLFPYRSACAERAILASSNGRQAIANPELRMQLISECSLELLKKIMSCSEPIDSNTAQKFYQELNIEQLSPEEAEEVLSSASFQNSCYDLKFLKSFLKMLHIFKQNQKIEHFQSIGSALLQTPFTAAFETNLRDVLKDARSRADIAILYPMAAMRWAAPPKPIPGSPYQGPAYSEEEGKYVVQTEARLAQTFNDLYVQSAS